MLFTCEECPYKTDNLYHYRRHLKNKDGCGTSFVCSHCKKKYKRQSYFDKHKEKCQILQGQKQLVKFNKQEKTSCSCQFCKKVFSRNGNLNRHMSVCKFNPKNKFMTSVVEDNSINNGTVNNNINNGTVNNTVNNDNSVNKNANITNNYIFNFGNEKTSYITPAMLKKCYLEPRKAIGYLSEMIHFHKDHPENHNIKVDPTNKDFAKVMIRGKWNYAKQQQIIDAMAKSGFFMLEGRYNECHEDLESEKQNDWDDFYYDYMSDENGAKEESEKNIRVMIFSSK